MQCTAKLYLSPLEQALLPNIPDVCIADFTRRVAVRLENFHILILLLELSNRDVEGDYVSLNTLLSVTKRYNPILEQQQVFGDWDYLPMYLRDEELLQNHLVGDTVFMVNLFERYCPE